MKISIGYEIINGPWGGGNRFVASLTNSLKKLGHEVTNSLEDNDIDLIIIIDPRSRIFNIPFGPRDILRYISHINPDAIVLHRINECDERKNTHNMNHRLRLCNYLADHTVFVGSWLKNLNLWIDSSDKTSSTILNGADTKLFNNKNKIFWDASSPLKLVTHHWSGNWLKGFDIYQMIDSMLDDDEWKDRIEFTYIGNTPKNFKFKNSNYLPALDSHDLANELRSHHIYLTASINEPGSNHQNEGALCGLPLLYRNSGSLPEYCDGFGKMYNSTDDFEISLRALFDDYDQLQRNILNFPHTKDRCINLYLELIERLYENRKQISSKRNLWKKPHYYLLNQIIN